MKWRWIFVLVAALVVAGCQQMAVSPPQAPAEPTEAAAEPAEAAEAAAEAGAVAEPVTLVVTFEVGGAAEQREAFLNEMFQTYMEEHPNVTIEFQPFIGDYEEYVTKLLVDLRGGVGPDIFSTTGSTLLQFAETGAILQAPPEAVDFIQQEALNASVSGSVAGRDGQYYGLPWKGDWPAFFYNKAMYEAAGISQPPANWDELAETAQKLTQRDEQGNLVVAGFFVRKTGAQLGIFEKWYPFFTAAGGQLFNDDMTEATFNSPEGIEALQFYVDLLHTYEVDSSEAPEGDSNGFIAGNVAQYIREPGNITRFQETAPDLAFGTALIPSHRAPARGIANIDALVVTKASQHPQEAWDLLLWLSSPEVSTPFAKEFFLQPIFKSVAADPFFQDNELIQPFLEQEADVFPFHPRSFEIETAIGRYIEQALFQAITPEEALNQAAEEVNALLQEE
jgi:ABC-type glycerol-3-phosphate transport system substrate-binding protein